MHGTPQQTPRYYEARAFGEDRLERLGAARDALAAAASRREAARRRLDAEGEEGAGGWGLPRRKERQQEQQQQQQERQQGAPPHGVCGVPSLFVLVTEAVQSFWSPGRLLELPHMPTQLLEHMYGCFGKVVVSHLVGTCELSGEQAFHTPGSIGTWVGRAPCVRHHTLMPHKRLPTPKRQIAFSVANSTLKGLIVRL